MAHVPLSSSRSLPFMPHSLGTPVPKKGNKPAHIKPNTDYQFFLRVPTYEDRDLIAVRMYVMGVRDVTPDQIQSLILSEIYTVYGDRGDDKARFMEGFWARQSQFQRDIAAWEEQEALRRSDEREAGREFEPTPMPEQATTPRERAEAAIITADVTNGSQRLREKLADQQLYEIRYRYAVLQLQLVGWTGLKTEAQFEPGTTMDATTLTKATVESIRAELMDLDPTGNAFLELAAEAERMFDFPASAEKNLSSPHGSFLPPDGSTTANTKSDTSDGNSNTSGRTGGKPRSSSARTRAGTSPTITEASSGSSPG